MSKFLYLGNFARESVGEPEIAAAIKGFGHTVDIVESKNTPFERIELMASQYDVFMFSKISVPVNLGAKRFIKETKVPTVCWLFDLYWGYHRQPKIFEEPHFNADIVFTSDGGHSENWKKAGIKHYCLRQGIEEGVSPGESTYPITAEVIFLGSQIPWAAWNYRGQLITWLKNTYGKRFEHLGEHGGIRHEKLNNLLATVKVVVGDSVNSPNYWSNRIYEMLGRGGFLIHPEIEGLEKEFTYYKHFVPYRYGDYSGLKQKIDYYLEHDNERVEIAKAGYDYCHKHHTYTKRVEKFLYILKNENVI